MKHTVEKRNAYRGLVGKPDGKRPKHGGGRIILNCILNRMAGQDYLAMCKDKWWAIMRNGNESSGSIKCGKFVR